MEWFVRAFLKASLVWLAIGVTLGVAMAAYPQWVIYRPAHLHMNLLGFVTMMIYGVAYHVIPRFTGFALHSRRLAGWHWWMANVGLALLSAGFIMRPHLGTGATPVLAAGGVISALAAYAFVYGIWRTMDGPAGLRRAAERAASSPGVKLPVAGS
ncbi:MAG TPA: cbb3-type cytochrome c oxidase subunit I, partial [Gemmatimonadales bacterium]